MKARLPFLLLAAALVALGIWSIKHRGTAHRPAPAAPAKTSPAPATGASVPIQDGKTIDFSNGKAVVKDDASEKAIIDKAVANMDAAAADVTFQPKPAPAAASATTSAAPQPKQ